MGDGYVYTPDIAPDSEPPVRQSFEDILYKLHKFWLPGEYW